MSTGMETPSSSKSTKKNHFDVKKGRGETKHWILEKYLGGWFPIMSQGEWNNYERIICVDGFAGQFTFKDGKDGSTAIALKTVLGHKLRANFKPKIEFIFIEKDKKVADKLQKEANEYLAKDNIADSLFINVINGLFTTALERLLDDPKYNYAPLFLFADPFGYSGKTMPMELLNRVMSRNKAEVFVNVNSSANRFFNIKSREDAITQLVGSKEWMVVRDPKLTPYEKLQKFINCFTKNLNAEHTLRFGMKDKQNRNIYHLVFGTNHPRGIEVMKRAMASASQDEETFVFSEFPGATSNNRVDIKSKEYKLESAKQSALLLSQQFNNTNSDISGSEISAFIWLKTPYVFNFKVELRNELSKFELQDQPNFDEIKVQFKIAPIPTNSQSQIEITTNITALRQITGPNNGNRELLNTPKRSSPKKVTRSRSTPYSKKSKPKDVYTPDKKQSTLDQFFPRTVKRLNYDSL